MSSNWRSRDTWVPDRLAALAVRDDSGEKFLPYYVYILASRARGTLYVGVTNDLVRRVHEHRTGAVKGFTEEYSVHRLVYFEAHDDISEAILREKRIKRWRRAWKIELIEKHNEDWHDLWPCIVQ